MTRKEYLQAVIDSQRSPIEVFMGIQEKPEAFEVVDVRIGDPAFLKEKIVNAKQIPLIELNERLTELDKTKLIYVATWSGACTLAKQASLILLENGYNVLEIAGGNEAWAATELPMEPV
ncbi:MULTISPECIES: rhodanese-like domain-containing protein [unclassified Enterococcus]|uniref:rhodanese-like domain-containing protein n=1 Tax=unclassified Enterococcus TaxID=2608891 RepID=UPI003D2C3FC9